MQKEKRRVRAGEGEEKVGLGTLRGDAQYLYAPLCRCTLGRYNEVVQLSREDVTFHLNKGAQKMGRSLCMLRVGIVVLPKREIEDWGETKS